MCKCFSVQGTLLCFHCPDLLQMPPTFITKRQPFPETVKKCIVDVKMVLLSLESTRFSRREQTNHLKSIAITQLMVEVGRYGNFSDLLHPSLSLTSYLYKIHRLRSARVLSVCASERVLEQINALVE